MGAEHEGNVKRRGISIATSPESYDVFGHAVTAPVTTAKTGPPDRRHRQVNGLPFIPAGQNAADASCPWTGAPGAWIAWL
jgi:hypothetical protein